MKYVPRIINKTLRKIFSENILSNKIMFCYYNKFKDLDFKISFKKGLFYVIFNDGASLKFYENPFDDIIYPLKGYLRNYIIKKGDIVIDAGAHIGTFALYSSVAVGESGKVIVFEPDRSNFNKLMRNITLNNAKNIIAINKGLWNKREIVEFDSRHDGGSVALKCKNCRIKGKVEACKFIKLDDIIKELKIGRDDFIKMDIEGAEIEALEGCRKTLEENNVNLAVASYHIRSGAMTCKTVESFLKDMGYEATTEFPEHLTTYALRDRS